MADPSLTESMSALTQRVTELNSHARAIMAAMSGISPSSSSTMDWAGGSSIGASGVPSTEASGLLRDRAVTEAAFSSAMAATEMNLSRTSITGIAQEVGRAVSSALGGVLSPNPLAPSVAGASAVPSMSGPLLGPSGMPISSAAVPVIEGALGGAAVPIVEKALPQMAQTAGWSNRSAVPLKNMSFPGSQAGQSQGFLHSVTNSLARRMTATTGHVKVDAGDGMFNVLNRSGQVITASPVSSEAADALMGSARTHVGASALEGIGGEGGALGGALSGLSEVGGLGMVADLADPLVAIPGTIAAGAAFMTDQRQKDAYYQGIYGGSNLSGLGQRAEEFGFRLSHFGDLSGAQADQMFQGVSATGVQGAQRTNALNMATSLYNDQGVPISESIQAIQTAIGSGNTSLNGLAEAISHVGESAKNAGVNAVVAYQQFNQAYESTVNSGITGQGGAALASGTIAAAANMGRAYASTGATIAKALSTPEAQTIIASNMGLTQEQYLARASSDPTWAARARQSYLAEMTLKTSNQAGIDRLINQARIAGGNPQDPAFIQGVVQKAEAAGYFTDGNTMGVQAIANQIGLGNLPMNQLLGMIANESLSSVTNGRYGLNMATSTAAGEGPIRATLGGVRISGAQLADFGRGGILNTSSWSNAQRRALGLGEASIGVSESKGQDLLGSIDGRMGANLPKTEYLTDVTARGKSDPILARLLKNNTYEHQDYTVEGPDGKAIIVNTDQLVAHFADQVQSGQAKLASGSSKGTSVADFVGMTANGPKGSTDVTKADLSKWGIDQTENAKNAAAQDRKAHDMTDTVPVNSKYVFDLSPAARKLFTMISAAQTNPFGVQTSDQNTQGAQYPVPSARAGAIHQ